MRRLCKLFPLGLLMLVLTTPAIMAAENSADIAELFKGLTTSDIKQRSIAVEQLVNSDFTGKSEVLNALLAGQLYYIKKDKRIALAEKQGKLYLLTDVFTKEAFGEFKKRKIKKVALNNKLRRLIKARLASQDLDSADAEVRLAAVKQMLNQFKPENAVLLRDYYEKEPNSDVKEKMSTVIALGDLSSGDKATRLQAVKQLENSLHPQAHSALLKLKPTDDPTLMAAVKKALLSINQRREIYSTIETVFFGLSLGSVLVLAAIGLAITFGVMGVINMAHGELIMIGAYTTYVIQLLMPNHIDISILVAIPAAFIISGLVGIAIERGVIRFLYGRPLETLLATFGISLILQQAVRSIFSPLNRSVETPSWMSGTWEINSALAFTLNRLYIIIFCLLVFALLFIVLKKTVLGLQVRAVSQNRAMARAMGVRSSRVDALTFGLGSGVAGIAGVALSQLTNVGPNLGQAYIIDSFMVVVFGGVGNLWGTLISGMTLGVANKFLEPWLGAVLAKVLVLVFIILFIQKRPRGLFPQKGRAAEN